MIEFPKICFVAPNAYPVLARDISINIVGGSEVQQCLIAKTLARQGYKVSMICLDFGQADDLIIDGVRIFKAHKPDAGIPVLRFIHPRITSLWRALKTADADIYYQRGAGFATGLVSFFCRQVDKKIVFAAASDSDLMPGKQLIKYKRDKLIYEWGLKHADVIITQSPNQQELCKKNYNRESLYIRSCCEWPSGNLEGKNPKVILWVGTVKPLKKPELFIQLAQRMPELCFKMVGGPELGNYRDSFYRKIKEEAAMISNLDFMGFVPLAEIDQQFNNAYLFVNTSEIEGFPNTFLQSWVRGIPTVSFFNPDVFFEEQQVGVVVNSIDEMVLRIKDLLHFPPKYIAASNLCKKYAEQFHSSGKIADDYSKVFATLLGECWPL
jgi:glycosyltransferase involved in cell wall biosynthesis